MTSEIHKGMEAKQNKDLNDKLQLNEGRKYCRMLPFGILQYF